MVFEFSQLARTHVCTHSFIHSFDLLKYMFYAYGRDVTLVRRACIRQFVPPRARNYRRLYSLIGPWPGFLLPCFLLCIPNYGGEFLGTDDSNCSIRLNFELKSGYLAIATISRPALLLQRVHSTPLHFASERSTRE